MEHIVRMNKLRIRNDKIQLPSNKPSLQRITVKPQLFTTQDDFFLKQWHHSHERTETQVSKIPQGHKNDEVNAMNPETIVKTKGFYSTELKAKNQFNSPLLGGTGSQTKAKPFFSHQNSPQKKKDHFLTVISRLPQVKLSKKTNFDNTNLIF